MRKLNEDLQKKLDAVDAAEELRANSVNETIRKGRQVRIPLEGLHYFQANTKGITCHAIEYLRQRITEQINVIFSPTNTSLWPKEFHEADFQIHFIIGDRPFIAFRKGSVGDALFEVKYEKLASQDKGMFFFVII